MCSLGMRINLGRLFLRHKRRTFDCPCLCTCAQLSSTLCDPTGCSPPDYFAHGIFQARILESRLPYNCPKECRLRTCSRKGATTIDKYFMNQPGVVGREEPSRAHLLKFLSVPHHLCMEQQTFVYQTFGFPSSYELFSSPWKSQIPSHNTHFCIQLKVAMSYSRGSFQPRD